MKFFKKFFSLFLRLGFSIILLVVLFRFKNIDLKTLMETIRNADKALLGLALFIFFAIYLVCFLRWKMLLKAIKIDLPLRRIITSFSGGVFFNLFLPSTIGGDFARTMDLSAYTKRPREIVATVFLDRLSGYVGLVILVLFSFFFGRRFMQHNREVIISVSVITGILIFVLLVLFNNRLFSMVNRILSSPGAGRLREALKNLHQEIYYFKGNKKVLCENIALSLLAQLLSPLVSYIIALSLGVKINIIYFLIFLPIIGAISLLPISIGGLGIRENMTVLFFAKAGMSQNAALAMSLLNFLFLIFYGAVGGLIYVLTVHHRRV